MLLSEETFEVASETESPRKPEEEFHYQRNVITSASNLRWSSLFRDVRHALSKRRIYTRETNELPQGRLRLIDNATFSYQVVHDCYAPQDKSTVAKIVAAIDRPPPWRLHDSHEMRSGAVSLLKKFITIPANRSTKFYRYSVE